MTQGEEQALPEKAMLPTIPLERYTEQGRQVLKFADEEARRLNHNYIGTEHLLLGILTGRKLYCDQRFAQSGR